MLRQLKIAILGPLAASLLIPTAATAQQSEKDNITYLKVFYNNGIRCGYIDSQFSKHNQETNEIIGLSRSLMDTITHKLELKLSWAEEITYGNMFAGMQDNRYDAVCTPTIANTNGMRNATYTDPLFFSGIYIYSVKNNTSIPTKISELNNSGAIVTVYEGTLEEQLAKKILPKAKKLTVPKKSPIKNVALNLKNGAAHIAILPPHIAEEFNFNNENVLVRHIEEPLRILPYRLAIPADEFRLKHVLDLTVEDMINNGQMDSVLDLYDKEQKIYIRRKTPFK